MAEIRVQGLTRLDSLDLARQFPDAEIAFEEGASSDPWHGELATVAVVTVTLAGLNALANWLMKDRREQEIERILVHTDDKGVTRTETIRIRLSESTTQAEVVKQLASITRFDSDAMR